MREVSQVINGKRVIVKKPELLAPAGNLEKLKVAILYGADAVFIGGKEFSLRSSASNFSLDDIKEAVEFAHAHHAAIHVTCNIILHEDNLEGLEDYLLKLDEIGVDAIIVADPYIMSLAKKLNLKLDFNANLSWVKNRFGYEDAISHALRMDPTQAVYDDTSANGKTIPFGGYFEWLQPGGDLNLLTARNPVAMLMQRNNSSTSKRIWGNFQVDYKLHFFKDLRAIVNLGYDKINGDGTETTSNQSALGYQPYGVSDSNYINYGGYRSYWDKRENKLLDAYLAYNKELNNLNISLTGGYSYQMFSVEKYNSGGNDYNPDELKKADITKEPDVNLQSFFGRANFDFYKKYFLTLTYRRDGSSRFSEANRWGNFPGAAFAWKIKDSNASSGLSNLKLRLGWGITGQQDVDAPYDYVRRISKGTPSSIYIFCDFSRSKSYIT